MFIYSGSAQLISFEINLVSKKISQAEPEYMNMHPPQLTPRFTTDIKWN